MSHCSRHKTVPALGGLCCFDILEAVLVCNSVCNSHFSPFKCFYVEGPDLYCKCDIFIFLYVSKMYWIHYTDEGVSVSSLLKTPCNGSESLTDNMQLWLDGNVGSELRKLNSRRAHSHCWMLDCQQQKLITLNLGETKTQNWSVIKARSSFIILLLCLLPGIIVPSWNWQHARKERKFNFL